MAKSFVGIDIGEDTIRMVCVAPSKAGQFQLIEHLSASRNNERSVKELLQSATVRRGPTRYSIRDGNLKVHKITIPVVPKEELEEIIRWSFKDAIKTPIEGYTLRHYPIGSIVDNKQSYLVLGIERKRLQNYLIELQKFGSFQPTAIEPQIQALSNCINLNYELKPADRIAIIHVDKNLAYLGVVGSEGILFCRTFARLTATSTSELQQFFSKIAIEIQYSYESYAAQYHNEPLTRGVLVGRDDLPGLQDNIFETLQIPIEPLNVFTKFNLTEDQKTALGNQAQHYGTAVGLAI